MKSCSTFLHLLFLPSFPGCQDGEDGHGGCYADGEGHSPQPRLSSTLSRTWGRAHNFNTSRGLTHFPMSIMGTSCLTVGRQYLSFRVWQAPVERCREDQAPLKAILLAGAGFLSSVMLVGGSVFFPNEGYEFELVTLWWKSSRRGFMPPPATFQEVPC